MCTSCFLCVFYGYNGAWVIRPFIWIFTQLCQTWFLHATYMPHWILLTMMTSSNGNIFRVTGPLCGEFTGHGEFPTQRPVTRSFDVFFDMRLNKRLSKRPWGWWIDTPSWALWRHCNVHSEMNNSRYAWWCHDMERFPYYWTFVREIHWSRMPFPTKCR